MSLGSIRKQLFLKKTLQRETEDLTLLKSFLPHVTVKSYLEVEGWRSRCKKQCRRLKESSELGKAHVLAGIDPHVSSSVPGRSVLLLRTVGLLRYYTPKNKHFPSPSLMCAVFPNAIFLH